MWPYFTGRLEGHIRQVQQLLVYTIEWPKTLWEGDLGTTVFSVPSSLDFIFTCDFDYFLNFQIEYRWICSQ